MRTPSWTISVTGVAEIYFKDCSENARHRLLKQAVRDGGNSQRPRSGLSRPFGYLNPPNRWSPIGASFELRTHFLDTLFQLALKLLDAFPVDSTCSIPVDRPPSLLEKLRRGLDPLLWTPQCLQRRSQQWRTKERSIQPRFAGKWPNWSGRAANMGTCPGSLVQRIGRSENGLSKPSEMLSVAMAV